MPKSADELDRLVIIGFEYLDGSSSRAQSTPKAYECFSTAAKHGHVLAQAQLSFMYYYDQWGNVDLEKARFWAEKAATQEDTTAAATLGEIYERGHGVVADWQKAAYWHRKAKEDGLSILDEMLAQIEPLAKSTTAEQPSVEKQLSIGQLHSFAQATVTSLKRWIMGWSGMLLRVIKVWLGAFLGYWILRFVFNLIP